MRLLAPPLLLATLIVPACRHEFAAGSRDTMGEIPVAGDRGSTPDLASDRPFDLRTNDGQAREALADQPGQDITPQPDLDLADPCGGANLNTAHPPLVAGGVALASCDYGAGPGIPFSQCSALTRCHTVKGWHLCKADEYQKVFPSGGSPPSIAYQGGWLAGCVSQGNLTPSPNPASTVCGTCASCPPTVGIKDLLKHCQTGTTTSNSSCADVGLQSSVDCNQVIGTSVVGFWTALPSDTPLYRVLCCK